MVFWIFGYGSLVWNPGFEYDEKLIGYIKDYRRVFDLACIDHRGIPEKPALWMKTKEPFVFTSTPDKEDNKYYLGPAPLEEMARQIATASGPCGNNREYIVKMEKALHDISHEDDYIIELANEVRKVLGITGSVPKEKKLLGPSQIPLKSHISPVKI
ncbi:hypothetical protein RND71_004945 [Anisodus tanguticus]|uniref:Gamma-glutamylcyclotransferase n=1 Tax=Anisodus tanguticus TaxID=243964 RepID=A0AAE1SRH2_9SOLA|nr:hypothetical protein RND71_004945 [Anisodus tanguticus]